MRSAVNAVRLLTDDKEIMDDVLKKSLLVASDFKSYENPFELYHDIQNIIKKNTTDRDPYIDYKKAFNRICMELADEIKDTIKNSENPFEAGLRVCLAGNTIDVMQGNREVNKDFLRKQIERALVQNLDPVIIKEFENEIKKAKKILFVGDNAGEIVFDRVFIELLIDRCKKVSEITYVVRGSHTLNDSTMEDAVMVGMDKLVKVITTGIDMPAAHLPFCSKDFMDNYNEADLVISKGQGNLEALLGEDKNIFFLLKIKCSVVAKILNKKGSVNDIVIVKNKKDYNF
jgi:uncharacterized protein with ATP-grasp and redox domains